MCVEGRARPQTVMTFSNQPPFHRPTSIRFHYSPIPGDRCELFIPPRPKLGWCKCISALDRVTKSPLFSTTMSRMDVYCSANKQITATLSSADDLALTSNGGKCANVVCSPESIADDNSWTAQACIFNKKTDRWIFLFSNR